jgi:hypothetical protein
MRVFGTDGLKENTKELPKKWMAHGVPIKTAPWKGRNSKPYGKEKATCFKDSTI